jgi:hypothetical protein
MTQTTSQSLTSDFDYLKIFKDDTISITTSAPTDPDFQFPVDPFGGFGSGEQGVVTIPHGLGTIPMVRAFIDPLANGRWYSSQAQLGYINIDPDLLTLVDSNVLKLCVNSLSSHKTNIPVFYRIYNLGSKAIDSDFRIDKIFSKGGIAITLPACGNSSDNIQQEYSVGHNQSEQILWTMQFSEDQQSWYGDGNFNYGPPDTNSGPPGGPYSYYYYTRAYAYGDSSNFYVLFEHNYPTPKTIYARWVLDYRS